MPLIDYGMLAGGALGFCIALAWNDAVQKTVASLLPLPRESARAALISALVVTIMVMIIALFVNRAHSTLLQEGGKELIPRAATPLVKFSHAPI